MTSAPGFRALTSSGLGRRTLRRMSASRSASAALATISAPCALSTSSEKRERAPAPVSTFTLAPRPMSFLTVSGETATRGSSVPSAVTAMVTMNTSDCAEETSTAWKRRDAAGSAHRAFASGPHQAIRADAQTRKYAIPASSNDEKHDPDLREQKKLLIGACVLGIVHRGIAARQIDRHRAPPFGFPVSRCPRTSRPARYQAARSLRPASAASH